jgi:hypothetical protein
MSADDKILKELDNATNTDQAREIILKNMIPECRSIGKKFFECVEGRISSNLSQMKQEELERKIDREFVPDCMGKFNLEECLSKFEKKI